MLLLRNSNEGLSPVWEWLVARYSLRNIRRESDKECLSCIIFLSDRFIVCTRRSASPLLEGWYAAVLKCLTALFFKNSSNSSLVNCVPLSVTKHLNYPKMENSSSSTFMMDVLVVLFNLYINGNFEKESIMTRNMLSMKGPAKSA